jgi:hypothetical protein
MVFPEPSATHQARSRPQQVQLDDRPNPQAAQRGSLLHLGIISSVVGDVYKVAASTYATSEEQQLMEDGVCSRGKLRKEYRRGWMWMERVDEHKNDCSLLADGDGRTVETY